MQGTMAKPGVRKLFTTGQIKTLIGIKSEKSVAVWIDTGKLRGVMLPGHNERRVHRDDLRAFCRRMGYIWALRDLDAEEGIVSPEVAAADAEAEAMDKAAEARVKKDAGKKATPKKAAPKKKKS